MRSQSFQKWARTVTEVLRDEERPLVAGTTIRGDDEAETGLAEGQYVLLRIQGGSELEIDVDELRQPEPGAEYVFQWRETGEETTREVRCLAPGKTVLERAREDRTSVAIPHASAMRDLAGGYQGLLESQKATLQPIADSVPSLVDQLVSVTAELAHYRLRCTELEEAQGPLLSPEITEAAAELIKTQGPAVMGELVAMLREHLQARRATPAPRRRRKRPD